MHTASPALARSSTIPALCASLLFLHGLTGGGRAQVPVPLMVRDTQLSLVQPPLAITIERAFVAPSANRILRRAEGMLWVMTPSGVFRFDGYNVRHYHEPWDKPDARIENWLRSGTEDEAGILWVGGQLGIKRLDDLTGSFESFIHSDEDSATLSHNTVNCMQSDGRGSIWIGTQHGLNRLDRSSRRVQRFFHDAGNPNSLVCDAIRALAVGTDGVVWAGTDSGLSRYDPAAGRFTNYTAASSPPFRLPDNRTSALHLSTDGTLWCATRGGLVMFDFTRGTAERYLPDLRDAESLRDSILTALTEDGFGGLWIGTGSLGLVRLDPGSRQFSYPFGEEVTGRTFPGGYSGFSVQKPLRAIRDLVVDPSVRSTEAGGLSVLWCLGDNGIWRVTVTRPSFSRIVPVFAAPAPGPGFFFSDEPGRFWVLLPLHGLVAVDPEMLQSRTFSLKSGSPVGIGGGARAPDKTLYVSINNTLSRFDEARSHLIPLVTGVGKFIISRDGGIWSATSLPDKPWPILSRLDPVTGRRTVFHRDRLHSEGITGGASLCIVEDRNGDIWFGTFGKGIFRFTPATSTYRHYGAVTGGRGTLKTNVVRQMLMDSAGVLWIGTDSGLHRYDAASDEFERFTTTGMDANDQGHFIRGMAFDHHGDIWLAHSSGISRFDRVHRRFIDYGQVEGLDNLQYVAIFFSASTQTMFALDMEGHMISFRPADLPAGSTMSKVILTEFRVFEQDVLLSDPIYRLKAVELPHDQNFLSFRFSALEFLHMEKINYAYRLVGLDRDWVQAGYRAYAGYTGLDPGRYTFEVKSTDVNGVWSDSITALAVVIHPPWWRTTWALLLFGCAGAVLLYALWRYDRKRVELRHALDLKDVEARKLAEIDRVKTRFFANISHEFRTPLTMILGPLDRLAAGFPHPEVQETVSTIQRNARRLLRLVNQLLDLSKLEAGRMVLQVCPTDVVSMLGSLTGSFSALADRKRISLVFDPQDDGLIAYVDREKIEKIVVNLLSNAFKFTGEGGEIVVKISRTERPAESKGTQAGAETAWFEVAVTDTGIGIPADQLERVFDRFYQVDNSLTREQTGSGIGLSLARELVELHHGYLRVTSREGEGSTFVVGLPLGKGSYAAREVIEQALPFEKTVAETGVPVPDASRDDPSPFDPQETVSADDEDRAGLPLVLVVEDNPDVRRLIRADLGRHFRIAEAADGVAGLEAVVAAPPDLILADIMMPRMDGIELCKRVKEDDRTSHIPVILLTARASGSDRVAGLESGADDYIIKPFEPRELEARVHNLVTVRRALREKFRRNIVLQPADLAITSSDERFLKRLLESVNTHLADPHCDTEVLAREVCMSRMQLNRKLQALTGQSTHEFLRSQRLSRAAQMLKHHGGNVSEIAYDVGFASPSHFARAFREHFGVTPSEYAGQSPEQVKGESP